jgi:hypothetical protein
MDWDDKVVHYLLVGIGIGMGSLIKVAFDNVAKKFWDEEWKAFKKWQQDHKPADRS